jgi:cytidine diphosphoramidate kinase
MVIWLVGLSGAGKSFIGRALYARMKADDPATVLVDGDEIRAIFRHDLGDAPYTIEGRRQNAERIRELCAWLDRQGINVVCCILSIFEESHEWNRANLERYFEVYVSAPMDVLIQRNPKDLYRRAQSGQMRNVVGVDIPYVPPARPDLVIENGANPVDPEVAANDILTMARRKFDQ